MEDSSSRAELTTTDLDHKQWDDSAYQISGGPEVRKASAGKSIDLTLFATVRALDIVVGELWARRKSAKPASSRLTSLDRWLSYLTDPAIFIVSSGVVMWTWFYSPSCLPRTYNKWIRDAAAVDSRLVEALRRARAGVFVYGLDTGQAPLLQSMCKDFSWPADWGDPALTTPIPCEIVHMGAGPSCEYHAVKRFLRAFRFAFATYLPLNLLLRTPWRKPSLMTMREPTAMLHQRYRQGNRFFAALRRAFKDSLRSSTFLGSFIALFYYSVCLARNRLGPLIFPARIVSPMAWDRGLAIAFGCAVCGWSVLLETPARRAEMAFFVAPRAAATLAPRRYDRKYQWREAALFSLSAAVVITCAQENPQRIRGVFGRLLTRVLAS